MIIFFVIHGKSKKVWILDFFENLVFILVGLLAADTNDAHVFP